MFTISLNITSIWGCCYNLVKWEYKVLPLKTKVHSSRHEREKIPTIEKVQKELNALGEEGWELVSVQNIRLETGRLFTVSYLKRQKP
jgi:ribosomal protein S24E